MTPAFKSIFSLLELPAGKVIAWAVRPGLMRVGYDRIVNERRCQAGPI
jgi:hypothetical protein